MTGAEGKAAVDENVVYIGRKELMSYVLAVATQFKKGAREVHIKARGNAIPRAIETADVARAKFVQGVKAKDIIIGMDLVEGVGGSRSKVPVIEIILERP